MIQSGRDAQFYFMGPASKYPRHDSAYQQTNSAYPPSFFFILFFYIFLFNVYIQPPGYDRPGTFPSPAPERNSVP